MTDKTIVLITGANTGIGYEAVKAFLQSEKKYLILMGSRSLENAETAIASLKTEVPHSPSTVKPVVIDVISDESIKKAFEVVESTWGRIDALVNNAGAEFSWEFNAGNITRRELMNKTFDVNVSGAYVMTDVFMPLLLKSRDPRLIFITSGQSSLTGFSTKTIPLPPSPPSGWPKNQVMDATVYRTSKSALNMMMLNLAHQLKNDNVKVWCVSPGMLVTGLGNAQEDFLRKMGAKDPSIGGIFIKEVIEGLKDDHVGKIVHSDGHVQNW